MSTLSGIISSNPIGGIVYFPAEIAGAGTNFVINGQEFLKSGTMKNYSAAYAPLITISKSFGFANVNTAANSSWGRGPNGITTKMEYANGVYYLIYQQAYSGSGSSGLHVYGSDVTAAPAGTSAGQSYGSYGDSISFKGFVTLTQAPYSSAAAIQVANGVGFYAMSPTYYIQTYNNTLFAANTSGANAYLLITTPQNDPTTAHIFLTTPNGNSWTTLISNPTTLSTNAPCRFCYSAAGNNYIVVDKYANIWTTSNVASDGWTLRTTPSNTYSLFTNPSSSTYGLAGYWSMQSAKCAYSSNVTLISLNYGQLLRTTDGTTFTSVNLYESIGTTYNVQQYINSGTGSLGSPNIIYDGSKFVIMPSATIGNCYGASGGYIFTSTDGITWTPAWRLYNPTGRDITTITTTISYNSNCTTGVTIANGRIFAITGSNSAGSSVDACYPFDITGKYDSTNPNIIGDIGNVYSNIFGTYSLANTTLSSYLRIA